MHLPRLYDLYRIAGMTFHKIFYKLWRIETIFRILYIHNYWLLYKYIFRIHIFHDLTENNYSILDY